MSAKYQVQISVSLVVEADSESDANQFTFSAEEVVELLNEQGQDFDLSNAFKACSDCHERLDEIQLQPNEPELCFECAGGLEAR